MKWMPIEPMESEPPFWERLDPKVDSKVVIAYGIDEVGSVLWYEGHHIYYEINENCFHTAEDLGLVLPDKFNLGSILVWEGTFRTVGDQWEGFDVEPCGEFREPTEEEWSKIIQCESPWNSEDFLKAKSSEDRSSDPR